MTTSLPCWGLAITAPSAETKVASSLTRHQIPHHLFRYRDRIVRRGKIIEILRPAFRPYVFVQILEDVFWHRIREVLGVLGFLHYDDGSPQIVLSNQINDLLKRATDDILHDVSTVSKFAHGDRVRFVGDNLFFGNIGYYDHPLDGGKAWVQLPWASGMAGMRVDERDLESVSDITRKRQRSRRGGRRRHRP